MTVKMIIATDQNFGIGINNSIPWDCPADMRYFRERTKGFHVVMGYNTFKSLPLDSGLPMRDNTVITRNPEKCMLINGVDYYTEVVLLDDVVGEMKLHKKELSLDIWVIGGASIYQQLLPYVEEIHHTIIDGVYDCDTYFNMEFLKDWTLVGGKDLSENAVVNIWRKSK